MRMPMISLVLAGVCSSASPAMAQQMPDRDAMASTPPHPATPHSVFQASSTQPFSVLLEDAMRRMVGGMHGASASGDPGRDFVTMMIPHHQAAIDMARALLAHSDDPELRNLAQSILVEQGTEITLMRAWLARHDQTTDSSHRQAPSAKDNP